MRTRLDALVLASAQAALALTLACNPRAHADQEPATVIAMSQASAPTTGAAESQPGEETNDVSQAFAEARALIQSVQEQPALPGAPRFEERRGQLLARGKAEPVLFIRTPLPTALEGSDAKAQQDFLDSSHHYQATRKLLKKYNRRPEALRGALLREGYLYTEEPDRAFVLSSLIGPHDLFDEQTIWIHRGDRVLSAVRKGKVYRYAEGPEAGQQARLMHLDRVGSGVVPPPLHRDLRSLQYRVGFDQMRVNRITPQHLLAELRFGERWVESVLTSHGARLELRAEAIAPRELQEVQKAKKTSARRRRVVQSLRETMALQVAERLPFDEPKTEIGQEDGILRNLWRYAYLEGRREYEHNGDTYSVFTSAGAPRVPQVCIDFVVDTFERAGGTWWAPREAERGRRVGQLDLRQWGRAEMRRTEAFVRFAQEHEDWFDVLEVSRDERIAMGHKARFFGRLAEQSQDYQAGDVVLIKGFTPWDEEKPHSHVFMIYETDPITGVPIVVAGNAGPANLWSWETEARRTPGRSIRHRIRARTEWLEANVSAPTSESSPAPLLPLPPPGQHFGG